MLDPSLEDGWRHKVQQLEGQINKQNEIINRFAQTALDAVRAEPPFLPCVIERLEDIIKLTRKESHV